MRLTPFFVLVACTHPAPALPELFLPDPAPAARLRTAMLSAEHRGGIRVIYPVPLTSCVHEGPNPVVLGPRTEPRVGTEILIRWPLDYFGPARPIVTPNGDTRPPFVWLLVSETPGDPLPVKLASAPGCALLVRPDHVFVPQPEGWLRYDAEQQVIAMQWTPTPGMAGHVFKMQLLTEAPGANELGMLTSPGLELRIGSAW